MWDSGVSRLKVDIAHPVETLTLQYRLRLVANIRQDDWGNTVLPRIDSAIDLPAAEGRYHQSCSINFRTGRNIPTKFSDNPKRKSIGRPIDDDRNEAFFKVSNSDIYFQYCMWEISLAEEFKHFAN